MTSSVSLSNPMGSTRPAVTVLSSSSTSTGLSERTYVVCVAVDASLVVAVVSNRAYSPSTWSRQLLSVPYQ